MKPFVDSALRPMKPPSNDEPNEPYLDESDIPVDSFKLAESNIHNNGTSTAVKNNASLQFNSQGHPDAPDRQEDDDNQFAIDNQTICR